MMRLNTVLLHAAKQGDLEGVREALRQGADVNHRTSRENYRRGYSTSLIIAASSGNEPLVHLLLENGADVNRTSRYGATALRAAVAANHTRVARLLLEHRADVQLADEFVAAGNLSMLHFAIHHHNREMVEMLLDAGADINRYSWWATWPKRYLVNHSLSPLSQALYDEDLPMAELLLERGADVNAPIESASGCSYHPLTSLEFALSGHRPELLRKVLEWGAKVDWSSEKVEAFFENAPPEMKRLLESRKES